MADHLKSPRKQACNLKVYKWHSGLLCWNAKERG
jgi:hypothetical protein